MSKKILILFLILILNQGLYAGAFEYMPTIYGVKVVGSDSEYAKKQEEKREKQEQKYQKALERQRKIEEYNRKVQEQRKAAEEYRDWALSRPTVDVRIINYP